MPPNMAVMLIPTQALGMVRRDGKWHIQLLTLQGDKVIASETRGTSYHRDLAEDEARKLARKLER